MTSRQTANTIQIVGLASLLYGIYAAWIQYSQIAGLATMFLGKDGTGREMFDDMIGAFNLDFFSLVAQQPWVWIGAAAILAPLLVGASSSTRSGERTDTTTDFSSGPLYVECSSCRGAVLENAPFCPHCGQAR